MLPSKSAPLFFCFDVDLCLRWVDALGGLLPWHELV
jgi:hypothetical protein